MSMAEFDPQALPQPAAPAAGSGTSGAEEGYLSREEWECRYPGFGAGTYRALGSLDPSAIDYELVVEVIEWIQTLPANAGPAAAEAWLSPPSSKGDKRGDKRGATGGKGGEENGKPSMVAGGKKAGVVAAEGTGDAVLVFLPGIKEITTLQELRHSNAIVTPFQRHFNAI